MEQSACIHMYRVRLHQHGGLQRKLLLLLDVIAHVTQLLLHHPHRLEVRRVVEGVTPQQQQLETHRERYIQYGHFSVESTYL